MYGLVIILLIDCKDSKIFKLIYKVILKNDCCQSWSMSGVAFVSCL